MIRGRWIWTLEINFVLNSRSDLHCVTLNVNTWTLWCFECKSELYIDSYKKLHEAVDHVKRVANTKSFTATSVTTTVKKDFSMPGSASMTSLKNVAGSTNSVLPRARGLNNLGNTCFFNSVMQCLSSTHPFVKFLDTHCQVPTLRLIDTCEVCR